MNLDRVLIVDGSYLIHRALHVESLFNLTNSRGEGVGGIYQFLKSLYGEMRKYPGYFPVVCWDNGLSERRVSLYPNYKRREDRLLEAADLRKLGANPDEDEYILQYHTQREKTMEILRDLGIPSIVFKDWEGDDLMYILAKTLNDTIVLTDDKDLIQLLSPNTRVSRPMANQMLDYGEYQSEHDDPNMRKFVISKSIVGDASDNIPSCAKGVGGKTAEKIANLMVEYPEGWRDLVESSTDSRIRLFGNEESYRQFDVNMQLIDLSLVDITEEMVRDIANVIEATVKVPNYFKVMMAVNTLETFDLDMNGMIARMTEMVTERQKE